MDFEKLIRLHKNVLEQKVEENVFLSQRIKARMKDSWKMKDTLGIRLRKYALVYSFFFIIFTLINFIGIGLIKKKAAPPQPEYIVKMDAFQENYPGSINKVYQEVLKWEN